MKSKRVEKGNLSITSRIILLLFFLGILTALYIEHYKNFKTRLNLQNIIENPEKYTGTYYQTMGRVVKVDHDFFYLLDTEANKEIPVLYPNHHVHKNDHLVTYGPFTSEGYMIAADIRFQSSEPFKYLISLFAGIFFLWMFFREWRLTTSGFEER